MRPAGAERGHVLVFALAALTLLTVMVLALGSVLRLDAAASANLIEARRARLVAEAGLERAIALLGEHELAEPLSSFHAPWVYRSQDGRGWGLDLPLAEARNPSFAEGTTPAGVAWSGKVATSYGGGDLFALRVVDAASCLDLNGPQPALGAMLDALGRAVAELDQRRSDPADPLHDPGYAEYAAREGVAPLDPLDGRGAEVVALRDGLGGAFQDLDQLEPLLGPEALRRLRPYVTVDAWRDPTRGDLAPVNVNTASWPVLVACLEGLAGDGRRVDPLAARAMADVIDLHRRRQGDGRLCGLDDLAALLRQAQEAGPLAGCDPTLIELALKNARPDLLGDAEVAEAAVVAAVDGDARELTRASVPFSFVTWGVFEVTSLGRVLDAEGLVVAEAELRAVVDVYQVARLVTQEDFEVARAEQDRWEAETLPLPVGPLAGPRRFRMEETTAVVYSNGNPASRRELRWTVADARGGWIQAAFAPPRLVNELSGAGQLHVFRLNADMQGEVWDPGGVLREERHLPLDGVHGALVTYGERVGVHPHDLGLLVGTPNPTPVPTPYTVDYGPDGLLVDETPAGDLRFADRNGDPALDALQGSDALTVRFKLDRESAGQWAPVFQALLLPDAAYGLPDGWVRIELEARGSEALLEVRSRIASSAPPVATSPPWLPPEQSLEQQLVEVHTEFTGAGAPHEWHTLTLVRHLNTHGVLLDGRAGQVVGGAPWPAPWWGPDALGTLAPGGYADLAGAAPARVVLDDLTIANLDQEGALTFLQALLGAGVGDRLLTPAARFEKVGPDRLGSFRGQLPRLPSPHTRVGALVLAEGLSERWGAHVFQPGDLAVQVSYALGQDPQRRQLSQRRLPPPDPARLADPYVRAWRLRRLRDQRAWLAGLVGRYDAWLRRAEAPAGGDPASAASFRAQLQALGGELNAVEGEIDLLLALHGEPTAPAGAEQSAAFGPPPPIQGPDPARVGFQVDLLFLDQLSPYVSPEQSPALLELILPYQERVRVLRSEWVDEE